MAQILIEPIRSIHPSIISHYFQMRFIHVNQKSYTYTYMFRYDMFLFSSVPFFLPSPRIYPTFTHIHLWGMSLPTCPLLDSNKYLPRLNTYISENRQDRFLKVSKLIWATILCNIVRIFTGNQSSSNLYAEQKSLLQLLTENKIIF